MGWVFGDCAVALGCEFGPLIVSVDETPLTCGFMELTRLPFILLIGRYLDLESFAETVASGVDWGSEERFMWGKLTFAACLRNGLSFCNCRGP